MYCGPEFSGWHGWFGFPIGWLFIGLALWFVVNILRREKHAPRAVATCTVCARTIDPHWKFCPACGKATAKYGEHT